MQYLLRLLFVFAIGVALPNSQAVSDCGPEVVACELSETSCGDAGCGEGVAPGGCQHCVAFGKILAGTPAGGFPVRPELLMDLVFSPFELPEGFVPAIEQPPRGA